MLAAVGATEQHLRLVMVASGAVTGAVAAVVGATIGVAGWIALVPRLESAAGYRIDAFNVPWWLVVSGHGARRARRDRRGVVAGADDGARPDRAGAVRTAAPPDAGPPLGGAGRGVRRRWRRVPGARRRRRRRDGGALDQRRCSSSAGRSPSSSACCSSARSRSGPSPGRAARLPVAARLALRDLGRYQARSGAALAAISLALGIPVAIVVTAAAAEHAAAAGNLSDHQLLVRTADIDGPFVPEAADLAGLPSRGRPNRRHARRPHRDRPRRGPRPGGRDRSRPRRPPAISLAERFEDGWGDVSLLYVATPELLDHWARSRPDRGEARVPHRGDRRAGDPGRQQSVAAIRSGDRRARGDSPGSYSSLPGIVHHPRGLNSAAGRPCRPAGGSWRRAEPSPSEQLSTARDLAAGAGLTIESRDQQQGLTALRTGATAVGMLLALGILAMTVGLIRSEAAGDVRTLTATGATSGTRRTLTAATAGGLALLGVVLGTGGAYSR